MEVLNNYKVKVDNMTCSHCGIKIEKTAMEAGAKNVSVNRENGLLTFEGDDVIAENVIASINETGIYKATKI